MTLLNNKDCIERLINILNYKKSTCQKKISELEKINVLKSTLLKYSDNPLKGIIELNDKELIDLFDEFVGIRYSAEDLEIRKYWINEAWSNPLIKSSSQYKESNKLFNDLIDKIQSYLDFTRSFILNKDEIVNELNLIDSLKDKLVNDVIISDIKPYYSLFIENETITINDIYILISSICINNLDLLSSNSNINTIENNKELDNSIINFITDLIEQKKKDEQSNNYLLDKINELNTLIKKIENNYEFLYDIYPSNIENVMRGIWDDEDIDYYIDKLAIPIALIKGKNKGLDMSLSQDDSNIINEFIDDLKDKLNKIKKEENKYKDSILTKNIYIKSLNDIVEKLVNTNDLLNSNDIKLIIDSYLVSGIKKEQLLDIINELNTINLNKYYKDNNTNVVIDNDTISVDKRDLKKLEILFNKYNYNYDSFPKKIIEDMLMNSTYEHIKEILEYIESIDKLSFIKDYTNVLGNSNIDNEIKEIKCSQICFILSYSTIEIISNIIQICENDNINLYDVFSIPKVFSSKKNKQLPGTYEDFVNNEKLIKEEYPELLNEFIVNYPFILSTDSELFKKNIELTSLYGLSIEKDNNYSFPSPLALATPNYEYVIDRYIEINEYDLVEKYRNLIGTNNLNDLNTRYKAYKNIDIEKNKYYHFKKQFPTDINKFLEGLSNENIPVAYTESMIKKLDKLNEETDENKKNIQYVFKGIHISKIKTLKYFSTFMINKYKNKKEALLYSLTKDSLLTEKEFNTLKDFIYGGK